MNSTCISCGNPLLNKRGDAKFCSLECKNEFSYRQRSGGVKSKSGNPKPIELPLSGLNADQEIGATEKEEKEQSKPPKKQANLDADFFNALINDNIVEINPDPTLKGEEMDNKQGQVQAENLKAVETDLPLPAQYITRVIQKSNPDMAQYSLTMNSYKLQQQLLGQEFQKLTNELNYHQNRNGKGLVWTAGLGGGILALLKSAEQNTKPSILEQYQQGKKNGGSKSKKKTNHKKIVSKNSTSNGWEKFFGILLGGAIGAGAGMLAKDMTEAWREEDKKQCIAAIKKRMAEINAEGYRLQGLITGLSMRISLTPKTISVTEKTLNPEYGKTKNPTVLLDFTNQLERAEQKQLSGTNQPELPFKSDKIMRATEIGKLQYKAFNFRGLWREFFGLPSLNFHLLIHGNSGEGKSTYAMWLSKYLAQNFGRVLYVCGEEGINMTFQDKLKSCKAEVENFFVLDVRTGDAFMEEIEPNEFHFIILDSLHDMDIDAKKMKEIFERYKNSAFICIDQNNKKGELLGANEKKHICDVVVNVKDYVAETTKNRFKAKGMIFKTEDFNKSTSLKIVSNNQAKPSNEGSDFDADRRNII